MDVTLRAANPADAQAVLDMWQSAGAEPSHTDDSESLIQLMSYDPAALIVAEADGQLIGSVVAGWDGWRGSIYRLVVAPEHRRRSLGRQLLNAAEQRLGEAGAVRLQAVVVESDSLAVAFWRASPWEEQVERLRFVRG